jgi:acyl-CoA thioesterase YciA
MDQNQIYINLLREGKMICRNSQFCKGSNIGVHGRMYGAHLMEELDMVCSVFAAEICDTPWMVTKKMDIEFVSPIKANQIYKTYVGIAHIGNTSLTMNAEIRKHSVHTEKEVVTMRCTAVFVRINEDGEPITISDKIREKFEKTIKS